MHQLPIWTFHAIEDGDAAISFPRKSFELFIKELHERHYTVLTISEVASCLHSGRAFPARSLAITFDDGYDSLYEKAWPVLEHFGMKGTVFVTTGETYRGCSTRPPDLHGRKMLSWSRLSKLHDSGFEIGAHTQTHTDLTCLAAAAVEREMLQSKLIVEDAIGADVASFAYPFGRHDHRSYVIAQHHFRAACSDELALVHLSGDRHRLARVDAYYCRNRWTMWLATSPRLSQYLAVRNVPRSALRSLS